nr:ABC transporter G family member 20-like [Ipomoea batatas]
MTLGELLHRVGDSAREKPNNGCAVNDHPVIQFYLDFQASAERRRVLVPPHRKSPQELSTKWEMLVVVNSCFPITITYREKSS